MDPSTDTVACPDCASPMALGTFVPWAAQTMLKSASCPDCGSTVTFPTWPDGSVDTTRAPIGTGLHGTTREAREMEVLVSRPRLEQQD